MLYALTIMQYAKRTKGLGVNPSPNECHLCERNYIVIHRFFLYKQISMNAMTRLTYVVMMLCVQILMGVTVALVSPAMWEMDLVAHQQVRNCAL